MGWDDAQQAWLARNSWGPTWGNSGYLWLGYGASDSNRQVFTATASDASALYDLDRDGLVAIADGGTDCDDFAAGTYPGAPETAGDGIDSDCDGEDPALPPPPDEEEGCAANVAAGSAPSWLLIALIAAFLPLRRRR